MSKNTRKMTVIIVSVLFLISMAPGFAFADSVSLTLSSDSVAPGGQVTASGQADPDIWVSVKILDSARNIVFFDALKSDTNGSYSLTFKAPDETGSLLVVTGYGSNVASKNLTVEATPDNPGSSGGGGGGVVSQAVTSTTGTATVTPGAGGTISLGSEATIKVPANALTGTDAVEVKVQKVTTPPAVPAGFKLAGSVYEFSVGGKSSYDFAKNVTIIFSFDPGSFSPGETPSVHYYDEALGQWVNIGGVVSGNTITVQVDHFTKFAVMAAGGQEEQPALNDIAGHWAANNINRLVATGAISGYPNGSFKPDNTITRAEFATVLVKAFQLASRDGKAFTDTAGHWAEDYIAAAVVNGIVSGYDDDTFGPDDLITREQMAVMIVKAAKLAPAAGESQFADSGGISGWAQEAVVTATENGLMKGYPDNTFQPQGSATRAEAVTVIVMALSK
jgi:hypothetical protein